MVEAFSTLAETYDNSAEIGVRSPIRLGATAICVAKERSKRHGSETSIGPSYDGR